MKEKLTKIGIGVAACGVLAMIGGIVLTHYSDVQQICGPVDDSVDTNFEESNEEIVVIEQELEA